MKRDFRKLVLTVCFALLFMTVVTGCSGGEKHVDAEWLELPEEDFIVQNLDYSKEEGLLVSGYTKPGAGTVIAATWTYHDNKWNRVFQKKFSCDEKHEIECTVYGSSKGTFLSVYTWDTDDDTSSVLDLKLDYEYYYVGPDGETEKVGPEGFAGIAEMLFTEEDDLYWVNYVTGKLSVWDPHKRENPVQIELSEVKKIHSQEYVGDYIFAVDFAADAIVYDTRAKTERTADENLMMLSRDLYDTELAGNDFCFAAFIDEDQNEIFYYADKENGVWQYRNGEKKQLLTGEEAGFTADTRFNDMAVKDEKTINLSLYKSENGIIE